MNEERNTPSIPEIVAGISLPVVPGKTTEEVRQLLIKYGDTFTYLRDRAAVTDADKREMYPWSSRSRILHGLERQLAFAGLSDVAGIVIKSLPPTQTTSQN